MRRTPYKSIFALLKDCVSAEKISSASENRVIPQTLPPSTATQSASYERISGKSAGEINPVSDEYPTAEKAQRTNDIECATALTIGVLNPSTPMARESSRVALKTSAVLLFERLKQNPRVAANKMGTSQTGR